MLTFLNNVLSLWSSLLGDYWSTYILPCVALVFIVAIVMMIGEIIQR